MMGRKRLQDLGCDGDDNTEVLIHHYNDNNDDDGNDNEEEELNEEELDDDYDDEREGILLKKYKSSLSGFSFIEMLGMGRRSQDRMPSLQEEDTLFSKPAPLPPQLLHLSTPLAVHNMPALLPSVSEQELLYSSEKVECEENRGVKEEEISQLVQQIDGGRATPIRKRRKRSSSASRVGKNVEEMENQRMVHIAVERNRRKQMNDHLAVLQSLMPPSYIQRGDQASIIGGAIEFVKELEQILQSLRQRKQEVEELSKNPSHHHHHHHNVINLEGIDEHEIGKVEVEMLGPCSLLLKVVSHRITGCKLLQVISVLQHSLHLIIRHLDITTIDHIVLYSFNIQMGDEIDSHSVHQLAFSVQQIFTKSTLNSTFEPLPN